MTTMLIASEGTTLVPVCTDSAYDGYIDVVEVKAGCPFPALIGDFLVAEENSLVNPPDMPTIYVKKGAPFPVLVEV